MIVYIARSAVLLNTEEHLNDRLAAIPDLPPNNIDISTHCLATNRRSRQNARSPKPPTTQIAMSLQLACAHAERRHNSFATGFNTIIRSAMQIWDRVDNSERMSEFGSAVSEPSTMFLSMFVGTDQKVFHLRAVTKEEKATERKQRFTKEKNK